ncbi:hypothetical protein AKJ09_00625 [Labilithrix luteola]|uniref:Uncharacterized protein n=2 Tax=Labilithrix luteola TaxID=1391654 RepID=A0A0K1PKP0_9BACT|nr:hypothetical protein AKJ09_00625 [Labilithrix luteola]
MAVTVATGLGWLVLLHARLAEAAPFELDWSAPEGCPSRERIVEASLARLGEGPSRGAPELLVKGNVTVTGASITADFQVRDAAGTELGERGVRFEESRCADITESAALVLAMMIAVARPQAAPSSPDAHATSEDTEPRAVLPDRPSRPARESQPPRERVPMTIGASALMSAGLLPEIGFGGALRWTATFATPVLVGLEGSFEMSPSVRAAEGEAVFRYLDAGALVGYRVMRSRWLELIPLVEARAGVALVTTRGFRASYDATRFVSVLAAGVLGRVPLSSTLRLDVLPDVRVPLVADEFVLRQPERIVSVHRSATIETRLAVGIAWEFR